MEKNYTIILILTIVNIIILLFVAQRVFFPTESQHISSFYKESVATLVSPHHLREQLERGESNYVLVDVREVEDYLAGHIITAINIPPDENLVENFKSISAENPNKEILTYCYTHVCMRGKKVGRELSLSGIYVKELGIGFNEWKNFWREWNYEKEWDGIDINDFIVIGNEAGKIEKSFLHILNGENKGGCSSSAGFEC